MATQPNAQSIFGLLDNIAQPLLVFNVAGNITFANRAAKLAPTGPTQLLDGHAAIRSLVREVALGKTKLPKDLDLDVETGDGARRFAMHFMPGPSGMDVAGLLAPENGAAPAGHAHLPLRQIIDLLRSELLPPVEDLIAQLNRMPPAASTSQIALSAMKVTDRLHRLADMVNVFGEDTLVEDNRVVIPDLVRQICSELAPEAERQRIQFVLVGDNADIPPIYGSENLLYRALKECLDNAVRHARRDVKSPERLTVEIRFTPSGQHLLVGIRNQGASQQQRQEAVRMEPFAQPKGSAASETSGQALRIGLPLAKRIVELHGGHIRLSDSETDAIQVLLELPTGAPHRQSGRLDMAQAQKYAADLAKLVSRQRKEKA